MTGQPSRRGATGPTLLVALCGLLGVTAACLLGAPLVLLGVAGCVALAALLIASYRDGRHDTERELAPIDADDALRLAQDPGPIPEPPTSAAELGRQLSDQALQRALRRRNRDQQ